MREVKPVFKLENPSVGTRKERILTDEMLVAFCESRLERLKDDIFDLFNEVSEYHESVLNRFEMHIAATPEIIASPYEVASVKMPYHYERKNWNQDLIVSMQTPQLCLNFKNGERLGWSKSDFEISIPFIEAWNEGGRDFDFEEAEVWHMAKCSMRDIDRWIDFKHWIYDSVGLFEAYIRFCEEGTGRSCCSSASNRRKPSPFQPNTNSTKTEPASNWASHPLAEVSTGFIAFRTTCRRRTSPSVAPKARAVRTWGEASTSVAALRVNCARTAKGRMPNVRAGKIK